MKNYAAGLAVLMLVPFQTLQAAYQDMSVLTRQVIIEDGVKRYDVSRPSYNFRAEIISDEDGLKSESIRKGRPFVSARADERYAVRLYNPLPVRVAVNLTVDGLNSITGKPSSIKDGSKWMIDPYSFITIRGWQVEGNAERRFFFTEKPRSYAKWSGDVFGKDLAANCGVIGAAFFWNQKELDAYYEANPRYQYTRVQPFTRGYALYNEGSVNGGLVAFDKKGIRVSNIASLGMPAAAQEAGTGMGEREANPTETVAFNFDRGMYHAKQAIVIYYDFADVPTPNPFPALSYAPEMPNE